MTSSPITDEMLEAALSERFGGYWLDDHMMAAKIGVALALRSSAPPVMGMEEMCQRCGYDSGEPGTDCRNWVPQASLAEIERLRGVLGECQEALVFTKNWMRTEAVSLCDYSLALSDVEGALEKVTAALSTPLVTGRDEQDGANAADAAPRHSGSAPSRSASRPSGECRLSQEGGEQ